MFSFYMKYLVVVVWEFNGVAISLGLV